MVMAQITIKRGQTWWDVGIEAYGAWEAGIDLALNANVSMSAEPPLGVQSRADKVYDRVMEQFCKAGSVSPATAEDFAGLRFRVFDNTFIPTFE